jgi:hypothetical protein
MTFILEINEENEKRGGKVGKVKGCSPLFFSN